MHIKQLKFNNRHGIQLAGRLELPAGKRPVAYAVFAHCFTCTKNLKAAANISRSLNREGIAVLRFDFTGLGESEGDFADTNFSSNVSDLVDAAEYLSRAYDSPQVLIGHSLGGAAVIQAAGEIDSVRAVAVIASPSKPDHVIKHLTGATKEIEARGEAEVQIGGRPFRIKKQFLENLEAAHMADAIQSLRRSLLVLHSPVDNIVGIENAAEIFQSAKHPKSFISLDRADHLLSDTADSRYAGAMVAAWSRKYLTLSGKDKSADTETKNQVTVHAEGPPYVTEIRAGIHSLVADEPESAGGTDAGPTPYHYLAAALGACKAITLRMYADRKKWPLKAIRIGLSHGKIDAEDSRTYETPEGYRDEIRASLVLEGDLSAEQRQRMAEIADRCPVHRTLTGGVRIQTRLEE